MLKLIFLLTFSFPLLASPLTFKDRLGKAKNGDYFVIEANKMISLIAIRFSGAETILIEEIGVPAQNIASRAEPSFWKDWVKKRAPGHTSWAMIELELETGQVVECYSFSRGGWMEISPGESLFATLLQLPLHLVPQEHRRRIGPPPLHGEADLRQVWEPPLIFEGKKQEGAHFEVFETAWPDDGSELAGKTLLLYFDAESRFPLPFWIQVESTAAMAQVRTLNAGHHFVSPHRTFPRRVPQFIGSPRRTKTGLSLHLKSPQYYRQFELYAVDITTGKREICPVLYSHVDRKKELLTIEVEEEELERVLKKDHRYNWLLVPIGYSESYTETAKAFTWR